jgi:hypothetical protein
MMQNFGKEVSFEAATLKTKKAIKDNTELYLREVGCENMNWIELAQIMSNDECQH